MSDISAAIRNAVREKTTEMQKLAEQLEDILYQAGLGQRRGSYNPTATLDCVAQLCPCRIAVWQLQATRESDL